jgi:hypothetical protein
MSAHEPLDYTPVRPSVLASIRSALRRLLDGRSVTEAERALATQLNTPAREAEARRTLRQPGASPDAVEKALRVLSRLGKSDGFTTLVPVTIIAIAAAAIAMGSAVVIGAQVQP